jgi:uncharacterized iron-regulated membrane protein
MAIRSWWLKLHLWVGLSISLVLLVVTISGALLVWEDDIDRALHSDLAYVTPGDHVLPAGELVARAKAAYPAAQLGSISFPETPQQSLQISARAKPEPMSIYVNQYTGEVLGARATSEREAGLARRIHLLHTRLFAGQIGEWAVGAVTALTLFMAITGIVLWWPRKIFGVSTRASGRRINFDLHNVFGLYASAVFLFIALTGMMIAFEAFTDPMIASLNATPVPELAKESSPSNGAAPMSVDALAQAAHDALPGAFLRGIGIPSGGKGVIVALMKYPEDHTPGGRSRVALDQYSGKALTVLNTRTAPLGTKILNIKRSAHTGDIFGRTSRVFYFLTCLGLAGQIITGFFIWWKRPSNVDAKARARRAGASAA